MNKDRVTLGRAPRPTSGADLAERVWYLLATALARAGKPVRGLEGITVDMTATIQDGPFAWLELADGSLAVELDGGTSSPRPAGNLRLSARQDAVVADITTMIEAGLRATGRRIKFSLLELVLESKGPKDLSVRAFARLRWADLGSGIRMPDLSVEAGTDLVLNARFG